MFRTDVRYIARRPPRQCHEYRDSLSLDRSRLSDEIYSEEQLSTRTLMPTIYTLATRVGTEANRYVEEKNRETVSRKSVIALCQSA